jgi:hypothetical protein
VTSAADPENRRSYAMNYGNGVLRRDVKWQPRSRNTSGPAFQKKTSYQRLLSYRIDPEAPPGRRLLDEQDRVAIDI